MVSGCSERLKRGLLCFCSTSSRQQYAVVLLLTVLCCNNQLTEAACDPNTNPVTYTSASCPTALVAAQALTNNNADLPISNAVFNGICVGSGTKGYILITNFGCHEFASSMPLGALVLSTGEASKAALITNTAGDTSTRQPGGCVKCSDPDMQAASTASNYTQDLFDQVLLSFDVTPAVSGNLAFQYVFGSEEYPEFVPASGSTGATNDVFGFFIWSGTGTHTNVALLPNSTIPVSIATVNPGSNSQYYIDNPPNTATKATEFDGFTTLLKTQDVYVTAGTTYHIKLGIADGSDASLDSVVWVKSGSVRFNIKDCLGSYVPNGPCSGACGGGSGVLPEIYNITVAAQNGGNACPVANGTTRSTTACTNSNPCPVNCTASWVAVNGSCTGACGGGSGFTQQMWKVTSPAMYGGSCANANGTLRSTSTTCTNNNACAPVNCVGNWVANGLCDGACGGGAGKLPEIYNVTTPAAYGGSSCLQPNGTTKQTTTCTNTQPCPINCTGSWVAQSNTCNGTCGGGSGYQLEKYDISTPAQYGGNPCPSAQNDTRRTLACTNNNPCPVNCTYTWQSTGTCTGGCNNGSGYLVEQLVISSAAMYGGWCPGANGTTRNNVTPCINSTPCPPVNCVGSWGTTYNCNGTCGGGAGMGLQKYKITTAAAYGGSNCSYANNTVQEVNCTNNNCCPVDCIGAWNVTGACNGACSGGTGCIPEKFIITRNLSCGGQSCSFAHNAARCNASNCINTTPCPPVNCVGSWTWNGACNGTCGGGAGIRPEKYFITTAARYNGTECPETNGTTRAITACNNTNPCPIDCVGGWVTLSGNCTGACQGGQGFVPEVFNVTTPAQYGGVDCKYPNGTVLANYTYRYEIPCTNNDPCPPQDCQGAFVTVPGGNCTGGCGGARGAAGGRRPTRYKITIQAAYGGKECPNQEGDNSTEDCINSTPCVNIPCNATWVANGVCNGTCGGGSGYLPQRYHIYTPANDNGTPCEAANNTLRQNVTCVNNNPCPINCVGSWQPYGACTGACNNGSGVLPEYWKVTTQAQYGGDNCSYAVGTTRATTACINYTPCPIDCVGEWVANGNCTGACGGGSGLLPERYVINTPAQHGGHTCPFTAGSTRQTITCINNNPCPINCVGHWEAYDTCAGPCNNGAGTLPERYVVDTVAMYGGQDCPHNNGARQNVTSCVNPTPCPIDCVGDWEINGPCSGACNNGSGVWPEVFVMTTPAQHGGSACGSANGTTRASTACINYTPCPVDCVGEWLSNGVCSGACGNGTGLLPQRYTIHTQAQHGGQSCPHAAGDTRQEPCTNTNPCPTDCVGHWQTNGACAGPCNNGTGTLPERYVIDTQAMYGGLACPHNDGDLQNVTSCINYTPCPINCGGIFKQIGPCNGPCNGGIGAIPEMFVVTVQAQHGGVDCQLANGTIRNTTQCINPTPCVPVNCVGGYAAYGPCSALCGGNAGFIPERFVVTTAAAYGGATCSASNGTTRFTTACRNDTVCPYASIQVVTSPPVLPPLNLSSFNESDIVIKGGNVSITGFKVEASSGSTSGNSSFTADKIEAAGNATAPNLKPRLAAFNGSLGFTTLAVLIDVVGEFELQRTMNWTWDTTWNAWITEVIIKGRFLLTREEIVNNVTTGVETMSPRVAGYLTLYSAIYPGPGFSGTYDWGGKLEMSPDPFTEWTDAADFLIKNTTDNYMNLSNTLPGARKRSRALLESSTGQVPVQGRVSVREPKEAMSFVGSDAAVLDETGDVMVVGPGPGPETNPNYAPGTYYMDQELVYLNDEAAVKKRAHAKLVIIVLASVLAPAGVAMCAAGIVAGVLYRRKENKEDQQAKKEKLGKVVRLHRHQNGPVAGRQQQRKLPRSRGWNFDSSAGGPPAVSTEPELDESNPGTRRFSGDEGDPAFATNLRRMRTRVEPIAPGETSFGSVPGGQEAMVVLPPRHDSVDWTLMPVSPSRQSLTTGWRASLNGVRSSFSGIANSFAEALRMKPAHPSGAYGISNAAAEEAESHDRHGAGTLLWSAFGGRGSAAAPGHREPTLPGSSSSPTYITKQGSLDMAAVIGETPLNARSSTARRPADREPSIRRRSSSSAGGNPLAVRKPLTRSSTKKSRLD